MFCLKTFGQTSWRKRISQTYHVYKYSCSLCTRILLFMCVCVCACFMRADLLKLMSSIELAADIARGDSSIEVCASETGQSPVQIKVGPLRAASFDVERLLCCRSEPPLPPCSCFCSPPPFLLLLKITGVMKPDYAREIILLCIYVLVFSMVFSVVPSGDSSHYGARTHTDSSCDVTNNGLRACYCN